MERWQSEGCRKLDPLDQERKVWGEAAFSEPGTRMEGAPGWGEAGRGADLVFGPAPGARAAAPGLSFSGARGIFLHQGLKPCLLHGQGDSSP